MSDHLYNNFSSSRTAPESNVSQGDVAVKRGQLPPTKDSERSVGQVSSQRRRPQRLLQFLPFQFEILWPASSYNYLRRQHGGIGAVLIKVLERVNKYYNCLFFFAVDGQLSECTSDSNTCQ